MPKIGQFRFTLDNPVMLEIWYKKGDGFYLKGLPEEFVTITSFSNHFATEGQLEEGVRDAIILYRELKTVERLSILYKCSATTELISQKIGNGHYSGTAKGVSEKIGNMQQKSGYGFAIEFKKVKIIDDGKKPVYYKIDIETGEMAKYSNNMETWKKEWQEIPFTEERLQFFIGIAEAMKKMIVQLSGFFGQDQEHAALFIDNKQKLLQ